MVVFTRSLVLGDFGCGWPSIRCHLHVMKLKLLKLCIYLIFKICFSFDLITCPAIMTQGMLSNLIVSKEVVKVQSRLLELFD